MEWIGVVPRPLKAFIRVCEMLGAAGPFLLGLTGIVPRLTPLAALGLALIMAFAIIFHLPRKEYRGIAGNVVLLILALTVAYGR